MGAHDRETGVDHPVLAATDAIHGGFHVVVDTPARHTAESNEGLGMGVKQHLMRLGRVRHQPEGPAGTELQVRDLNASINATHHQPLLTPVKLEGFAKSELQRNEGLELAAFTLMPVPHKVRHPAVAAGIALILDLREQRSDRAAVLFGAKCVGL